MSLWLDLWHCAVYSTRQHLSQGSKCLSILHLSLACPVSTKKNSAVLQITQVADGVCDCVLQMNAAIICADEITERVIFKQFFGTVLLSLSLSCKSVSFLLLMIRTTPSLLCVCSQTVSAQRSSSFQNCEGGFQCAMSDDHGHQLRAMVVSKWRGMSNRDNFFFNEMCCTMWASSAHPGDLQLSFDLQTLGAQTNDGTFLLLLLPHLFIFTLTSAAPNGRPFKLDFASLKRECVPSHISLRWRIEDRLLPFSIFFFFIWSMTYWSCLRFVSPFFDFSVVSNAV